MEVKDVIICALTVLGRKDIAENVLAGGGTVGEEEETVNTLLYCFNAVEDEIARKYFPLTAIENLQPSEGRISYKSFSNAPVRIKRVTADGKQVEFKLLTEYMAVNGQNITVEYEYAPSRKTLDGVSDFGCGVGEYLLALGIASEYCLINGEIESAELFEKKYRAQIDIARKRLPSGINLPPRRWV